MCSVLAGITVGRCLDKPLGGAIGRLQSALGSTFSRVTYLDAKPADHSYTPVIVVTCAPSRLNPDAVHVRSRDPFRG